MASSVTRAVFVAVLALSLSLAGCIPAKFSGYKPIGNGSLAGGYCVAGIKDRLRVHAPSGVEVLLYAEENEKSNTILLGVDLIIPEGVSVQLLSSVLVLQSPEWAQSRTLAIHRITAAGPRVYEPSAVLPGSSQESMGAFTLWFLPGEKGTLWETGVHKVLTFTLSLPALSINGRQFQVNTVAFEAYREWGMYTCVQ